MVYHLERIDGGTQLPLVLVYYGPGPLQFATFHYGVYVGLSPFPVTVTTRIITFLVGDPYKPSFATITGRGDNPMYMLTSQ